jgi:hypothetical protein
VGVLKFGITAVLRLDQSPLLQVLSVHYDGKRIARKIYQFFYFKKSSGDFRQVAGSGK